MKPTRIALVLAAVAAMIVLSGCESGKRERGAHSGGASTSGSQERSSNAEGLAAQSDADRAEETLERQKQQDSAERRPYSQPPPRPVDQPRTPPPSRP